MRLQYAGFRIYLQDDGLYKCFGTGEWADAQGGEDKCVEASRAKETPGEALAEAIELTKVLAR